MDIITAFLNNDLQEEVYVEQASGFAQSGHEHKVFRLQKALRRCMVNKRGDLLNPSRNTRYLDCTKLCMDYIKLLGHGIRN
jgi:hypothetical protein